MFEILSGLLGNLKQTPPYDEKFMNSRLTHAQLFETENACRHACFQAKPVIAKQVDQTREKYKNAEFGGAEAFCHFSLAD